MKLDPNSKKILIVIGFIVTTCLFVGWVYLAFIDMVAWALSWIGVAELIILGFGYFTISLVELIRNKPNAISE